MISIIGQDPNPCDAQASIKQTLDRTLYRKFNNQNLAVVMELPCFPLFAKFLRQHEATIMSGFERDVAFCRYQCFQGLTGK